MNKIIFPLKAGAQGSAVADLQDALALCMDRGVILADAPDRREQMSAALRRERAVSQYADATKELVAVFQESGHLPVNGVVDKATADALNTLLAAWDMLAAEPALQACVVGGMVHRDDGTPLRDVRVRAAHLAEDGVIQLGEDDSNENGAYTIRYQPLPGIRTIRLRVSVHDTAGRLLAQSDLPRGAQPVEIVNLTVHDADIQSCRVEGQVASRVSTRLDGLQVVIVDKGVGGDIEIARTTTTADGRYAVTFSDQPARQRGKSLADLQARVFAGDTFLGASGVRYNALPRENLDVLLDDEKAVPVSGSEHEALRSALGRQFGGKLSEIEENAERQDITYLANKTGWDARAVALAALAERHSEQARQTSGAPDIPPAYFYALFRAGLSANDDTVYQTGAKTLERIWTQAAQQGVIPTTSAEEIGKLVSGFQAIGAQKLLTGGPRIGASPLTEMLSISRLDPGQQTRFAELYAARRNDMGAFWNAVGDDPAFGQTPEERAGVAKRLQVDGKLAFLTINNAPLIGKLHNQTGGGGLSDPLELAQAGYHRAQAWIGLLGPDVPIPPEIPGETPDVMRANYGRYLAAQIRLSYPTAAVAEMVGSKTVPLPGADETLPEKVQSFLNTHQEAFDIGAEPIEHYLARRALQAEPAVVGQIKRVQRVYQITASDEAMAALMKHGVDAAYHVARYDKASFVRQFAGDIGDADEAALTYERAVQIHNSVLNIALGYLTANAGLPVGVHSPPSVLNPIPSNASDVLPYATLETALGSMEFCACEHCRSILSPAAYLTDLLLFLNSDADVWQAFITRWHNEHANLPYPFADAAAWQAFQDGWNRDHPGEALPNTELSPFDVLMARRPDIQHLPLTCENTNTALPYVDVVNEMLEYYVVNGLTLQKNLLAEYGGHDTGDLTTEDLLASPQFVMDTAYTALNNERFPAPLPFHQPLESLRRYFRKFDVPLPLAMERLRTTDALERGSHPYGWRDIWQEEIGLSREEAEILTDSAAVPLWRLAGFAEGSSDADVIEGLSNAEQFARRTGISNEELVAILGTGFVNPASELLPKLERLGLSFATLKAFKDNSVTDAQFDQLFAELPVPPDPAQYGGDIKAWVRNEANYARIMSLLTLTIPAVVWTAAKDHTVGDCVVPTSVTPATGAALYYECTGAGVSGATEPAWPTVTGATCVDGTAVWTCRDAASCRSFEKMAFRYADPARLTQNLNAVDYIRLLRFIRLWKKLGWTILQTDAAITALDPPLDATDPEAIVKLNTAFQTLLCRIGIAQRVMTLLGLSVRRDLPGLLACWSNIGTHGTDALYRQLFLNPALLKQDPVFSDNGYGDYLSDAGRTLADHAEAVRSACNLTHDEYNAILADLKFGAATVLNLANVSAIYRRGWLARKLKISVRELLLLMKYTGLDPFAPPDPAAPAMLRLISLVQAMKDQSFKTGAALYLLWNQDLSGKSAPQAAQMAALARDLRNDFAAIDDQFAALDGPPGDVARQRVELVYGQDTSDAFFSLLDDTLLFSVPYTHTASTLEPAIIAADARIAYDDFRHQLSHRGLMTVAMQMALKSLPDTGSDLADAVDALLARSDDVKGAFFVRNPELQPAFDQVAALDASLMLTVSYTHSQATLGASISAADGRIHYDDVSHQLSYAGLLTVARRDTLKRAVDASPSFQQALDALFTQSLTARGTTLLANLQPTLIQRRKRQQALQRLAASAGVDLIPTQTLLDSPSAPYPLHATGDAGHPALDDVLALQTSGLEANFYLHPNATGTIDLKIPAAMPDYGAGHALPTAASRIAGSWRGQLQAPEDGFYNLIIETDSAATASLALNGKTCTLTRNGVLWRNSDPIELQAGSMNDIVLTVENLKNVMRLRWETPTRPRDVIPSRYLYPLGGSQRFYATYLRFLKVTSLMQGLGLTANCLAHLAVRPEYRIAGDDWPNALQTEGDPDKEAAAALLAPLLALLGFARMKAAFSTDDESLLAVLQDPVAASKKEDSLLFAVTRWNKPALNDILERLGIDIASLAKWENFQRVADVFSIAQAMGIPPKALMRAATNAPDGEIVRDLQGALSARYDADSWRDLVKPINDDMRGLQRDALVASIIHKMRSHPDSAHIDTPDKLFEYFLTDVQMDTCMQTSRVRHALSSVQLFIERCLMNLEPRVSPAAINASQWEWMKRYRVWEANRKVFLYPENWLEPELRDDKSSFCKELESELLQSDVTEESAAVAMRNYLIKLEEVAKLEHCGIFYLPPDPATRSGAISHVIARTMGASRKYFYRRQEYGYWTPWEQIKLDIEDNPIMPVVWNGRLFLFWLRIVRKGPEAAPTPFKQQGPLTSLKSDDLKTEAPTVQVCALLCFSEYFNGKWQPTRTSDPDQPLPIAPFKTQDFDRSKLNLSALFWTKGSLRVIISYANGTGSSFFLHNAISTPELRPSKKEPHFTPKRKLETATDTLRISYTDPNVTQAILQNAFSAKTAQPNHPVEGDSWDPPFFYQDARYVFHVSTTEELVTVPLWQDFGVQAPDPGASLVIPPLVKEPPTLIPDPIGPVAKRPGYGVIDPSPIERYVTEDAYIHQAITTLGTVQFDKVEIGPAGSQVRSIRTR